MNAPETSQRAGLRDYLAAERTFLAWVRTGLALMGFGFVVARFGLFLQEFRIAQHLPPQSFGLSSWFGTVLIGAGVMVNLFSGWLHVRLIRKLDRGEPTHARPTAQIVAIAFFLALVGLAMAIYLLAIRNSAESHSQKYEETPMTAIADNGIVNKLSNHSVDQTVEKLKGILQAKGVTLFALVDHSGEAGKGGNENAPHQTADLRKPEGGHSPDAGGPQ